MTMKQKCYLGIFSLYTAVNLFLVYKIHETGNLRDGWEKNYVRQLRVWDVPLFVLLCVLIFMGCRWIVFRGWPRLARGIKLLIKEETENSCKNMENGKYLDLSDVFGFSFFWCFTREQL